MNVAVVAVFHKVRMGVERVVFAVLEDEYAAVAQPLFGKNPVGNFGYFGQLIGRIGKNQVVCFVVDVKKTKHIAAIDAQIVDLERGGRFFDECDMAFAHLDTADMGAPARHAFKTDAAGARKKVECCAAVQIEVVVQHIEQALFGKIGCGTCRNVGGWIEVPPSELSADDAHIRLMFMCTKCSASNVQAPHFDAFVVVAGKLIPSCRRCCLARLSSRL